MMRSNRPSAVASARKSHARALHAHNNVCCARGTRERAIHGGRPLRTAWVLLASRLGTACVL
eukprot:2517558-Lingulodinium_polyedra.AAC.1